jgi:hypothetical protein
VQLIPIEESVFHVRQHTKTVEALPGGRASDNKQSSPKKKMNLQANNDIAEHIADYRTQEQ